MKLELRSDKYRKVKMSCGYEQRGVIASYTQQALEGIEEAVNGALLYQLTLNQESDCMYL